MKANELMIGDWIFYGDKPVKVLQLSENSKYDWVKPIPLTYEILKKNGWYWGLTSEEEDIESCVGGSYGKHWVYDEGAGEISLIFPDDTNGGLLKIDDQGFNRYLEFIWNDTLYVHELQRALRICGLDELADNFKV